MLKDTNRRRMMTKTEKQKLQRSKLHSTIWEIACSFWGKMEADDYKDYVLGLLFYRFLSQKIESTVESFLAYDEIKSYEEAWAIPEYQEGLTADLTRTLGYVIEPKYLFSYMIDMITKQKVNFEVEYLQKAINSLMESTICFIIPFKIPGYYEVIIVCRAEKLGFFFYPEIKGSNKK